MSADAKYMQHVPLSALAAELNESIDDTAARLGDALHTDPASGVRMVPAHISRQLLTAHHEQLQAQAQAQAAKAEAERQQQERLAAEYAAQDRVRQARAARQREILTTSPDLNAVQVMLAADANPDDRTPAGRTFDELYAAERQGHLGYMYRFPQQKEA